MEGSLFLHVRRPFCCLVTPNMPQQRYVGNKFGLRRIVLARVTRGTYLLTEEGTERFLSGCNC